MKTKVIIFNADNAFENNIYKNLKEQKNFWVYGTYNSKEKNEELIKLDISNEDDAKTFLIHFRPDILIWLNDKENVDCLNNIFDNIYKENKFIYISDKEYSKSERIVKKHENYVILKTKSNALSDKILEFIKTDYKGTYNF